MHFIFEGFCFSSVVISYIYALILYRYAASGHKVKGQITHGYKYVHENVITIAGCVVSMKFVTRKAATVVTQIDVIAHLRATSVIHSTFVDICDNRRHVLS